MANVIGPAPAESSGNWERLDEQKTSSIDREWKRLEEELNGLSVGGSLDGDTTLPPTPPPAPAPVAGVAGDDRESPQIERWGRFEVREKVGQGAFGHVYRVWDPELRTEFALKVLHRRVSDERLRRALLHEGRALAQIAHPNVVRVLDLEFHGDQMALRMEFVRGETLEELIIRNGTLSAREATLIAEDVCRALAAVHLAGYVHRDIKPGNVMREQAGRIVLMDFGAGRDAAELQMPGRVPMVGTPLYMAPELFVGVAATPTSDVYSVGVLLYALVTGRYPVEGRSLDDIRRAHMEGRRRALTERRSDLPRQFVQIVDKALSPDPAKRFANAGLLLAALSHASTTVDEAWDVARLAGRAFAGLVVVTSLGALTTGAYNVTMARTAPFDEASLDQFMEMGLRSLVSPFFMVGVMWLVARVALSFGAAAIRHMQPRRRRQSVERVVSAAAALGLADPTGLALAVASVGIVLLAGTVWLHLDLLKACVSVAIVNGPLALRQQLAPGHAGAQYRMAIDVVIVMCLLAIAHVRAARMGGTAQRRAALMPLVGVLTFAVVLSVAPWRILGHNTAERLSIGGERCYFLGDAAGLAQVYCPDRDAPRTRIVALSDPALVHTGVKESVFTPREAVTVKE